MITVIGWDGSGLSAAAKGRIREATLVTGPARLLRALRLTKAVSAESHEEVLAILDAHLERGQGQAVVLGEGAPGYFGVVRALQAHGLRPDVLPQTPLAARAFARAGLAWDDALVLAPADAGELNHVVNACRAHHKVAVLVVPGVGPAEIARELAPTTPRALIVCENLGGPDERVTHSRMGEATTRPWKDPDVVLVLDPLHLHDRGGWVAGARPGRGAWALPFAGERLPAEVRAYILAKLGPRLGDLIWDVGAGSGAIAVECARLGAAVVAVERDDAACARLRRNVIDHGVKVALTRGHAPPALEPLPDPDAVFVGGGGADVIVVCAARKPRTLVCALGDEAEARAVLERLPAYGYRAQGSRIQVDRLDVGPAGSPAMTATAGIFVLYAVLTDPV